MSALSGSVAGACLALAISQAANFADATTVLLSFGLCLFGQILGRIADRLAPR
jgi:hypothetical protein